MVGPATRFISSITYSTCSPVKVLALAGHQCSAALIRRIVSANPYPGRARIGNAFTDLSAPESAP
jgi:hypothetical protein